MSTPERHPTQLSPLPPFTRLVTTHSPAGDSTFHPCSGPTPWTTPLPDVGFSLIHSTSTPFPLSFENDTDLAAHAAFSSQEPAPLVNTAGVVFRIVDTAPPSEDGPGGEAQLPFMHRTESLDYAILISGTVECVLDNGESRVMRPGDVLVQRGVMHGWRVLGREWVRMAFVMMPAVPVTVGGRVLGTDMGGLGADVTGVVGQEKL